jgi:hypothetical protein
LSSVRAPPTHTKDGLPKRNAKDRIAKVGQGFSKILQQMDPSRTSDIHASYVSQHNQTSYRKEASYLNPGSSKRDDSVVLSGDEQGYMPPAEPSSKMFMGNLKKKTAEKPVGSTLQSKFDSLKSP